jgi:hypothetical protein
VAAILARSMLAEYSVHPATLGRTIGFKGMTLSSGPDQIQQGSANAVQSVVEQAIVDQ